MLDWIADTWNTVPMWLWWVIRGYAAVCLIGTIIGVPWQLLKNREGDEKNEQ